MTIRVVNNRRYLFEKQQSTCDFMKTNYSVTEINQHNKKISVTRVLPFKVSFIISMIKEGKLDLEKKLIQLLDK